jgi:tripartite-type tricarboxylate transporter receptor subunit TctC
MSIQRVTRPTIYLFVGDHEADDGLGVWKRPLHRGFDPSWATPRDAGIPDLDASIWVGLFAPKGTPQPIVDRLNREVRETLKLPDVQKRFIESAGGEAVGMTQGEFLARIKADAERYKRVVQKAGVKPS